MENNKKKKKKGSAVFIVIIVICIAVIIYALYNIISIQMNYKAASDEYDSIRESVVTETETTDTAQGTVKEKEDDTEDKLIPPLTVDHKSLLAQNEDYAGWIYIEALGISYPIMQSTDNDFYLHRTFEKEVLFAGSIFMDFENSKDFSDPNTIVYGHNMKDDSMFGNLNLLYDSELYKNSSRFWILTPDGNYLYEIFSMQRCEDTSDTYTLFSAAGTDVADYISKMKSQSLVDCGEINYNGDSKVVTLSTCVYAEGTERFVVQGIRVE